MLFIFLLVLGFFFTSLMFYLNHRFVGHGKLGKWPLLKHIRKMHIIHHRNDYNEDRNNHLRLPTWSKALFFITFLMISLISVPFAAGYFALCILLRMVTLQECTTMINLAYVRTTILYTTESLQDIIFLAQCPLLIRYSEPTIKKVLDNGPICCYNNSMFRTLSSVGQSTRLIPGGS